LQARCSFCGMIIQSRASSKNSARTNLLKAVRKHIWKNHRTAMIGRMKAGKRTANDNPTVQDFISALQGAPQRAILVYQELRKRDWIQLKQVMDAMEGIMPVEMRATWKAIEAFHDTRNR